MAFCSGNQHLCGSFGLITANNVHRLIDYRVPPNKHARKEYFETTSACTSTSCTNVNKYPSTWEVGLNRTSVTSENNRKLYAVR